MESIISEMATDNPTQNADLETNSTVASRAKQRWHRAFAALKKLSSSQLISDTGNYDGEDVVQPKDLQLSNNPSLHNSSRSIKTRSLSSNKLLHDINQGEICC